MNLGQSSSSALWGKVSTASSTRSTHFGEILGRSELLCAHSEPIRLRAELVHNHQRVKSGLGSIWLPAVPKKLPTQPEPFNFLLDSRSSRHNSFSVEENVSFKAQPATVLKKEPFVPEKPPKQSIEIEEFHLFTDKRASERLRLKQIKDAEEREKEKALQIQKALEEEQERLELKKLRAEIVHKANPVRQFKPVEIKPSSIHFTKPNLPNLRLTTI
ncbi:targeting protein for Xklp2 [Trichonephila inaurata madagascariensis]|uniref:Targeting protein for Xklp2 n=1 Tax=Trichonephila inaurata madagascariensis TaxID=2747483 RepID=A0A8X7CIC3_9ARAC|nr:targeting protein for Xklp2 [Trichonephila inaurata madagascariensis]